MDNKQKRYIEARKRIMSPREVKERERLLQNRDEMREINPTRKNRKKTKINKTEKRTKVQRVEKASRIQDKKRQEQFQGNKANEVIPKNKVKQRETRIPKKQIGFIEVCVGILVIPIVVLVLHITFYIQDIKVVGNENYTSEVITEFILQDDGLTYSGINVWYKYNYTEIEYPIGIENISVEFLLPWKIQLTVRENEIIGGIHMGNQYAYYDKEGYVLKITDMELKNITVLEGVDVTEVKLFEKLPIENIEVFENLLEVGRILEEINLVPEGISTMENAEVVLFFGDITVYLGSGDYDYKIPYIEPILAELGEKEGVLHLENYSSESEVIIFK